jgi:parvulin-like peptidyl-prolyl isomerase
MGKPTKPLATLLRGRVAALAIGASVLLLAGGCGKKAPAPQGQVVADVNGQAITKQQIYDFLETSDGGDAARRALDALILRQLIRQDAAKKGIKVSTQEIAGRINAMKDYVLASTGKDFDTWLRDTGETMADLEDRISFQVLTAKLLIPERQREDYFASHKQELQDLPHNNESVIFRQIVVATRDEAEALRKQLEADKRLSFARLAEEKSLDPMTRSRGGMAGWLVKGKLKPPDPDLEKALFSLKPGEISQPVKAVSASTGQTPAGQQPPERWRIVKVEKHIPPHEVTLADNQDMIEEWMLNDPTFQAELQQFFTSLRGQAKVEVLDPHYKLLADVYKQSQQMPGGAALPRPMPAVPEAPGVAPRPGPAARRAPGRTGRR